MCHCDKNICKDGLQNYAATDFLDEVTNELAGIGQLINNTSLTADNLYLILSRLIPPVRQLSSFCRGISMLDARLAPIAEEVLFLSNVLDEVRKQIIARGSPEEEMPEMDLCLISLEIRATASGLCLINPQFCPLANSIGVLSKIVCAVIPPLKPSLPAVPKLQMTTE